MTQYVSHISPNNIHLSVSDLSWQVQGYVNVCVCCNAGLGLSHETELYQATTHSSSRPPALNAPADLSSLPSLLPTDFCELSVQGSIYSALCCEMK